MSDAPPTSQLAHEPARAPGDEPPRDDPPAPPVRPGCVALWTRGFVALYLAAFLACGLFAIEAWPLTGWRLFSHLRHAERYGWQAYTFDSHGRQTRIDFAGFPRPYRHLPLIMRDFGTLPQGREDAVCRAWADRVHQRGIDVAGVKIYRTRVDLHRHLHRRQPPRPTRHVAFVCADGKGARRA